MYTHFNELLLKYEGFPITANKFSEELSMLTLPIKNGDTEYPVQPTKIIALGMNYRDHIAEGLSSRGEKSGKGGGEIPIPEEPVLFPKTPNALLPPEGTIIIPAFLGDYHFSNCRTDYEGELALIVKDRCKNVPEEEVLDHIYGFTCFNDVSQRNFQRGDTSGWFRGKSLDTFAPIGPCIVLTQDLPHFQELDIITRKNGKEVQKSNTKYMIFSISKTFSFISRNFTLEAGDIITTGTPSGVGPLKHGDSIEIEIQDIGILRNSVTEESQ